MTNAEREELFQEAVMGAARPLAKLVGSELAELVRARPAADPEELALEARRRIGLLVNGIFSSVRSTLTELIEQGLSRENLDRLLARYRPDHLPQA